MGKLKRIVSLFLQYAFCIAAPVLSVILLSNMMLNQYKDRVIAEKQSSIERAFEGIQGQLDDIENILSYIGNSELIEQYVYTILSNKENSVQDYQEIIQMLKLFEVGGDITEIYLYDSRENRMITTSAMLSDASLFFHYGYQVGGTSAEENLERLKALPSKVVFSDVMTVKHGSKTIEVIECSVTVPFELSRNYPLHLIVVVEAEALYQEFFGIAGEGGEFYVYDQSDKLIIGSGDKYESLLSLSEDFGLAPISHDRETIYGAVLRSVDGDYQIKVYIPRLYEEGTGSWYVTLLMVFSVLVSMVFCIYFTVRNQRAIEDIMGVLGCFDEKTESKSFVDGTYGYLEIKKNVDRLVSQNAAYLEELARLEEIKKYQFLNKLLHSESGELMEKQGGLDPDIKDDKNMLLCIRYENSDYRRFVAENVTIKDLVKMFMKESIEREVELFDPSAKETVCIIYGINQENSSILMRDIVARLNLDLFLAGGIQVVMGASDVVESIYEVHEAYTQAKAVINYQKTTGKNILMYSEMQQLSDDYYYPANFDDLLNNYVIAGKTDAKRLVERLYSENVEKRMLTIAALDKVKRRVLDCVRLIVKQYDIHVQETMEQLMQEKNIEQFFTMLVYLIDVIAKGIEEKRQVLNDSIVAKILNYLNDNYTDSGLSLGSIAHELGFEKDYVSKMFKAEYGENLSVVLEKIRIEKACELLTNTDIRVSDVSVAVGYNSDISFRRAFKKVTGLTPTEYKENVG